MRITRRYAEQVADTGKDPRSLFPVESHKTITYQIRITPATRSTQGLMRSADELAKARPVWAGWKVPGMAWTSPTLAPQTLIDQMRAGGFVITRAEGGAIVYKLPHTWSLDDCEALLDNPRRVAGVLIGEVSITTGLTGPGLVARIRRAAREWLEEHKTEGKAA